MTRPPFRNKRFAMGRGGIPRLIAAVTETLAVERERWVLWLPVAFGAGIAVYFALPAEPPLWLGAAAIMAAAACAGLGRRRAALLVALLGIATGAAGFTVAQWRTAAVAEPMLSKRLGPTGVSGRIVAVERFPKGSRISLERLRIARLGPQRTPAMVRLRLQGRQPAIGAGDWIRVRAVLSPPPPPAAPGAFDFQRQSYFRRLGAVGFAFGPVELIAKGRDRGLDSLSLGLERLRQGIADSVMAGLHGRPGTIAAALMTGTRKAIEPKTITAIRDAGLAHLLAISGLHVGLVAAILFVGLRGALALAPPLALRYPIKKWAAAAAIIGAFAYALLAGATVPTQRAFLMIGLVLLAVLFDRRGLSMRLVAWAAFVILLLTPESLLGASFQLSFAAVTALIAAYEVVRDRRRFGNKGPPKWPRTALLYVAGVALTTVIAETATA
ncbi:MAG: ComEC/Rec2 family competence protein, partial [Rhodospirillales bacterium]